VMSSGEAIKQLRGISTSDNAGMRLRA
jgi:hypothetical protein